MDWPADADGDVLRRLRSHGCDFDLEYPIEFQIDFETWPPPQAALTLLNENYGSVSCFDPEADFEGYVQCVIPAKITYDLVTSTQTEMTVLLAPFGGRCECWGVLL